MEFHSSSKQHSLQRQRSTKDIALVQKTTPARINGNDFEQMLEFTIVYFDV